MKKILFVGLYNGQIHHELPIYFLAQHYEVTCVGLQNHLNFEDFYALPKYLNKIPFQPRKNKLLNLLFIIKDIIRIRKNFDILYLYSPHNTYLNFLATIGYKGKIIYHSQDFLDSNKFKLKTFVEKYIMKKSNINIVNELNRGIFLKNLYNLKELPLIQPTYLPSNFSYYDSSVSDNSFKDVLTILKDENKFIGIHIGGFSDLRCTEKIIESLKYLEENHYIVFTNSERGSSSHLKIMQLAEKYNVERKIILLGKLSQKELFKLSSMVNYGFLFYDSNDIGNIYQSPGRLTELIGVGTKILCTKTPSFDYLILKYNDLGYTCDSSNSIEISKNIKKLLEKETSKIKIIDIFKNKLSYEIYFQNILKGIKSKC